MNTFDFSLGVVCSYKLPYVLLKAGSEVLRELFVVWGKVRCLLMLLMTLSPRLEAIGLSLLFGHSDSLETVLRLSRSTFSSAVASFYYAS